MGFRRDGIIQYYITALEKFPHIQCDLGWAKALISCICQHVNAHAPCIIVPMPTYVGVASASIVTLVPNAYIPFRALESSTFIPVYLVVSFMNHSFKPEANPTPNPDPNPNLIFQTNPRIHTPIMQQITITYCKNMLKLHTRDIIRQISLSCSSIRS